MRPISVTLEGEKAIFSWKDGKVYTEGYDLESEKAVLALTGFGKGIGVLLVAMNTTCKSEAEFISEVEMFVAVYKQLPTTQYDKWPKGQLIFEYFSYSPDPNIRWIGMESARLSERHYKRILADPEMIGKIMMAMLDHLPEKYFYPLAILSNSSINFSFADNPNCPSDVLELLAKDNDDEIRSYVAANPAATEKILELLAQNDDVTIRWNVAQNPKCPARILKKLARDESVGVRQSVLYNPSCPKRIMKIIAKDQDQETKRHAQGKLKELQGLEI